ncbi:uncharacterized protein LY89DRAFT_742528 [Mollisia scopiformis]|uniref:Uncharacterized protein n=1 Tax=Mollisia scopiformis TaxID=149040 RepID=A0A132B5R4_MOLSC|nr:uncharacterized protein LY89DRAFT_742528 [Mollisia scopiformis]KUJ07755.1 hypothetical protein LY89DRAFT_742528 [Mollisia scopiformis]
MRLFVALSAVLPLISAEVIVGQLNFYYDTNCKSYAGSVYPSPTEASSGVLGNVRGGPAGSKSLLWVSGGLGPECQGPWFFACKNKECSAWDGVEQGECKSFENGVWGAYQELCPVGE